SAMAGLEPSAARRLRASLESREGLAHPRAQLPVPWEERVEHPDVRGCPDELVGLRDRGPGTGGLQSIAPGGRFSVTNERGERKLSAGLGRDDLGDRRPRVRSGAVAPAASG